MARPKRNPELEGMRRMIHQRLLQSAATGPVAGVYLAGAHLDEDALSAFIEGRLSDRESGPIVSHLVGCNSCRRFTAALMRLESEVGDAEAIERPADEEPGRIRRLLEDLAARVLPVSDEVFAYHAPAEDFEPQAGAADYEPLAAVEESEPEDEKNR
ncbi:MAG TPA: zf-HC2 domain-containing protein [Pyrinomonadaceae bacterium]